MVWSPAPHLVEKEGKQKFWLSLEGGEDNESYFAEHFPTHLLQKSIKVSLEHLSVVKIIHFVMPSNTLVVVL